MKADPTKLLWDNPDKLIEMYHFMESMLRTLLGDESEVYAKMKWWHFKWNKLYRQYLLLKEIERLLDEENMFGVPKHIYDKLYLLCQRKS